MILRWKFVPWTFLPAFEDYASYSLARAAHMLSNEWTRLLTKSLDYRAVFHFGVHILGQEYFFKVNSFPSKRSLKNYMILRLQTDGVTAKNHPDGQMITASSSESSPGSLFLEKSLTEACELLLASEVHVT